MNPADAAVRDYVADVVGVDAGRITGVHRFAAGERHVMHLVSYRGDEAPTGRAVVVRAARSGDSGERASFEREGAVLAKVSDIAGPGVLDGCLERAGFPGPVMCLQHVEGVTRELASASSPDIERLGALVGWLHALPVDDLDRWFPGPGAGREYVSWRIDLDARKLAAVRDPLPAAVQQRLRVTWERVHERSAPESDDAARSLLHGDVATNNVVWSAPGPVLIDWEYARLGDPADEVAYVFGQNDLPASLRAAFLRGYAGSRPAEAVAAVQQRAAWWEPVNLLGSVLWWIERWSDPGAPKAASHYLAEALARLERLERPVSR